MPVPLSHYMRFPARKNMVLMALLKSTRAPSLCSLVETPFGGAAYHPLFAAAATPLPHSLALAAAQRLMELGAAVNVRSRDCSGEHTPLSKALALRNLPLAQLLVQQRAGASRGVLSGCRRV